MFEHRSQVSLTVSVRCGVSSEGGERMAAALALLTDAERLAWLLSVSVSSPDIRRRLQVVRGEVCIALDHGQAFPPSQLHDC